VVAIYDNGNDTYNVRIPLSGKNDLASSGERKQD
jgi:hypothetical protein